MTTLTLGDFDFYLYYLDSLKSDWQNFYNDAYDRSEYYNLLKEKGKVFSKTINTIIKHLNKQEFKRFMKIHEKLDIGWYSVLHKLSNKSSNKEGKLSNIFYQIFKTKLKEEVEHTLEDLKYFKYI